MILTAFINETAYDFDVPQEMLDDGESFFSKIDADMDQGYQMSREYVEKPGRKERCQIVADRILDAMSEGNKTLALLLSAYILDRMPGVTVAYIDTEGDILNTNFGNAAQHEYTPPPSDEEAHSKVSEEMSEVYKVGRVYRFSVRNPYSGKWQEAPAVKTEEEAQALREVTFNKRVKELKGRRISLDE